MPQIPLEDNFTDVIGKAMRGLNLADSVVAERAHLDVKMVQSVRSGEVDEVALQAIAPVLGLHGGALAAMARMYWTPGIVQVDGLAQFNTVFEDMTVNAYLVWDPATRDAALFDTGSDASDALQFAEDNGLRIGSILLTHTHGDHIFDLDRVREKTRAAAFVGDREPLKGAESFEPGRTFQIGSLRVETRLTWGHSKGGITYVVAGLARPVAVVGDAVFASSMGGGGISYADALRTNRAEILTLSDETVLCPGHGPMTTVGEEKAHNPFFAR